MKPRPPAPHPPVGDSGLPDLNPPDIEVTATRQTETQLNASRGKAPSTRPILTVLTGFDAGKVLPIVDNLVIGRGSDCGLVLSDPGISRAHARVTKRAEELVVDLGSKNGTSVGDKMVGAAGQALQAPGRREVRAPRDRPLRAGDGSGGEARARSVRLLDA